MISMVEKITRYNIEECFGQRDELVRELQNHKNEFLECDYIMDFEREWVRAYVDA